MNDRRPLLNRALAPMILALLVASPQTAHSVAHGEAARSGAVGESSAQVDTLSVGVDSGSGAATLGIPKTRGAADGARHWVDLARLPQIKGVPVHGLDVSLAPVLRTG